MKRVKASIIECVLGILAFDETNKLAEKTLFPKDPIKIAERLAKIEAGKLTDEIETVIGNLKEQGFTSFVFENAEIAQNAHEKLKITVEVAKPSKAGEFVRANLENLAVKLRFVKETSELRLLLHQVSVELTKMRVRKAVEKRDLVVMQAILTIDDLDRTVNLFMGRIREWYGLHFPELDRLVEKHETYARLVVNLGKRDNFTSEGLEKEGLPKAKSEQITMVAEKSMGGDLEEPDLTQIQTLCKNALQLHEARQSLESYMDSIMEEVAPNIKSLAGSLLGARLIALTGGLTNLAKMPASTVQVLGAEKALFRSLKTGTRPPKHGIIFQHTLIHEAKRWQRGKMARAIAGKLAIAARTDAFSGKYIGDVLKIGLDKRIEEIQKKYEAPPPVRMTSSQQPRLKDKPNRRMNRGHKR
jgi:nucleolar protein 56